MALQDPATGKLVMTDVSGQRIDVDFVDYKRALALETLCPGLIVLEASRIATGHSEASLIRKLGTPSRVLEPNHSRSRDESLAYYRRLMLAHPNTMHYYALRSLQESAGRGWFKVVEWESTRVGKLRAYLDADTKRGPFRIQLLHIVLPPAKADAVGFIPGQSMVLERRTAPTLRWDVGTNAISVVQPQADEGNAK
jgi:hypothetical protein